MSEPMPSTLTYTVREMGVAGSRPRTVLHLEGHLRSSDVGKVEEVLELAAANSPRQIDVDLNDTIHVDPRILTAILAFRRRTPSTRVLIDVSHVPGPRLMDMLQDVLDPYGDEARQP